MFSDHSPGFIKLSTLPPDYGTRPFRFYNMLLKHPSFSDIVKEAWTEAGDPATTLSSFCFKLKSMKRPMKSLCKENYSGIEKRVFEAAEQLKALQMASLQDPSSANLQLEKSARENWLLLRQAEESFFRQRSETELLVYLSKILIGKIFCCSGPKAPVLFPRSPFFFFLFSVVFWLFR